MLSLWRKGSFFMLYLKADVYRRRKNYESKGSDIMLKTSQLEIFKALVDCGSMSKAAEYLNTSQPYLSRVLKSMEEEMGKTLLVRGKQGVYPTRDGKFIYDYTKTILQNLKKIEEFKI